MIFPLGLSLLSLVGAEEVLGSFIFVRHGDRLQKPTLFLTPIGATEVAEAGSFYRERYFNTAPIKGLEEIYNPKQVGFTVASSDVLFKSVTGFAQSFYPPVSKDDAKEVQGASLANGTEERTPLDGYQYVMLDSIDEDSASYWTVEGDGDCPAYTKASNAYFKTNEFSQLSKSSESFYKSLEKYVEGNFDVSKLSYKNAYKVFDHFLTQKVHNETFAKLIDGSDVFYRVTTLQDQYSRALNYNPSDSASLLGGKATLGQVATFLDGARNTSQPQRVAVLGGSYDQFYQIFALLDLYKQDESLFTGVVDYASSVVFELVEGNDYSQYVRVGVRNGTTVSKESADLVFWPVFNSTNNETAVDEFQTQLKKVALTDVGDWCTQCSSKSDVCKLRSTTAELKKKQFGLSLVDAGGIGAGVTAGTFLICGALLFGLYKLFSRRPNRRDRLAKDVPSINSHPSSMTQVGV